MSGAASGWFAVANADEIPSPALLVYPDRVEENIRRMITMAGGVERLRPHMKTHKMAEIIRLQTGQRITKFKCATIAEAELTAGAGGLDVLLAYQPVGPNVRRFIELIQMFPVTKFSTVVDDGQAICALAVAASAAGVIVDLLLDIDCGQHRCGVEPGPKAVELYRLMATLPSLHAAGLHVYDGHIHDTDATARTRACEAAFAPVLKFRQELAALGLNVSSVVAGGTPTFPIHARREAIECSPGTCVLWDYGYSTRLPDLDFLPAALLLTRVISKPGAGRLCLDLGHKSVAS
ncbi:MAG TPA: D-TA family PLP-dependent enzyme, partial [Verrucomicrobiae bacterium]